MPTIAVCVKMFVQSLANSLRRRSLCTYLQVPTEVKKVISQVQI